MVSASGSAPIEARVSVDSCYEVRLDLSISGGWEKDAEMSASRTRRVLSEGTKARTTCCGPVAAGQLEQCVGECSVVHTTLWQKDAHGMTVASTLSQHPTFLYPGPAHE